MFHAEEKGRLNKSKTASFELKILFGHWSWSPNGWRYPKITILPAFSHALSILIVRILLLWSESFKKQQHCFKGENQTWETRDKCKRPSWELFYTILMKKGEC